MGFGQGGYFAHFEQPAADAYIRLNDVDGLGGEQVEKFPAGVETLTGGQGNLHLLAQAGPGGSVFGAQGLLVKVGVVGGQCIGQLERADGLEDLGVGIEGEFKIIGGMLANFLEIFGGL